MKKTIFLLIALIFSACSPQVIEPPTATSTPHPTQTPIPTPTLHPKFIELQNTINAEDGLVLTNDGTIEHNGVEVPDVKVTADGRYVLVVGDEMVMLDPNDVTFGEDGITIDGYTLNENGEWVEAELPIKEFPWCKDFTQFANPEYFVPMEELQEHARFAQSQLTADLFDVSKLNLEPMQDMRVIQNVHGALLVPNTDTAPNYQDPATAPFAKDFMCGMTEIGGEKYFVVQVPHYVDRVDPTDWPVMTGVLRLRAGYSGAWPIAVESFIKDMNVVPWNIDADSKQLATNFINPATGKNFTVYEVQDVIAQMKKGDFSGVNGLVLEFVVGRNSGGWFE